MKRENRRPLGLWSTDEGRDLHVTVSKIHGDDDYVVTVDQAPISLSHREATILRRQDLRSELAEGDGFELEELATGMRLRRLKTYSGSRVEPLVGRRLFRLLFPESSVGYDLLGRCCDQAQDPKERLKLLMKLPEELVGLPWETLESPANGRYSRVLLQRGLTVVRFQGHLERRIRSREGKDVVLLVMANPVDVSSVKLSQSFTREQRTLAAWFQLNEFQVEVIEGPDTRKQLEDKAKEIARSLPQSCGLHFIGHGGTDEDGGYLVGVAKDSSEDPIHWDDLRKLLEPVAFDWAVFNACETARAPVGAPLASIANSFSTLGEVPLVLAYLRPVETHDAEALAQNLYSRVIEQSDPLDTVLQDLQKASGNPGGLVWLQRLVRSSTNRTLHPTGPAESEKPVLSELATKVPAGILPEMIEVSEGRLRLGLDKEQMRTIIERFEQRPSAAFSEQQLFTLLGKERNEIVLVPSFEISKTPITRRQFRAFLLATDYRPSGRGLVNEEWQIKSELLSDLPMTFLAYRDVLAFCKWAGCRLPTGNEWKRAFRSSGRRLYPWGDIFDPGRCHCAEGNHGPGPLSVGRFPNGKSSNGCLDLVGNIWEWTSDRRLAGQRLILGGSSNVPCEIFGLPLSMRWALAQQRHPDLGFRVVRGIKVVVPRVRSE